MVAGDVVELVAVQGRDVSLERGIRLHCWAIAIPKEPVHLRPVRQGQGAAVLDPPSREAGHRIRDEVLRTLDGAPIRASVWPIPVLRTMSFGQRTRPHATLLGPELIDDYPDIVRDVPHAPVEV